ncbi:MAG: hypothetical protein ABIQ39_00550, partial [Ilumatobacteraceae bacterium]
MRSLDELLIAAGLGAGPALGCAVPAYVSGDLVSGDPVLGDPVLGDPVLGDPVLGDPVLGDPVLGDAVPGDTVLGQLVEFARTDPLAGRVVLQRLLPGLSAIARRRGTHMREHLEAFDELLSAAWSVISNFPVERRRHHVAASLLRDCEYHAFRRDHRRAVVHDYSDGHDFDRAMS